MDTKHTQYELGLIQEVPVAGAATQRHLNDGKLGVGGRQWGVFASDFSVSFKPHNRGGLIYMQVSGFARSLYY